MSLLSFNSNILAQRLQRFQLESSNRLSQSFQQLSSGSRINRASDDAAGLSVSSQLRSQARVFGQAVRNSNDGISMLNIAGGALTELSEIVGRLKELSEQAANGTFSRTQRLTLDTEANSLTNEFNRIVGSTVFNGLNLLNGLFGRARIQMGYGLDGSVEVGLGQDLDRTVGTGIFGGSPTVTGLAASQSLQGSGDFNGDGNIDVVVRSGVGTYDVYVGNGSGAFSASAFGVSLGTSATDFQIADLNQDGLDDIVATGDSPTLITALSNGSSFVTRQTYTASPSKLALSDINSDGTLDLITTSGTTLTYYQGLGGGSFATSGITTSITSGSANLRTGDFNGDGIADLVSGTDLLLGDRTGRFAVSTISGLSGGNFDAGDINHDGITDLVQKSGTTLTTYIGSSSGTFTATASTITATGTNLINLADLDGDGDLDLVLGGTSTQIFTNDGGGNYRTASSFTLSSINTQVIADANNDGVPDFIQGITGGSIRTRTATTQQTTSTQRFDLTTQAAARSTLDLLNDLQMRIQTEIGSIGSLQSRLSTGANVLNETIVNTSAAEGRISDTDVASEASALLREQIRMQITSSLLAQANVLPQVALSLLRQ